MLPVSAILTAQFLLFHLTPSILATPLQFHLPTLFNSAPLNSTTLPTINTGLPIQNDCFEPRPDHLPTNYLDCESAVLEINKGADLGDHIFGRGSRATYKLPRTFRIGTCVVNLDMIRAEQTDTLTLSDVEQAALALARQCVSGAPFKAGGVAAVGPRKVLYITMFGVAARGKP